MNTSPAGIAFIKAEEGLRLTPYLDAVGVWTVGYGHARWTGGAITEAQAEALLVGDIRSCEACVNSRITVPITQGQFDALVSLCFNCGTRALVGTTLERLLNSGDYAGAADELLQWCHGMVDGKRVVLPGLLARRQRERAMFLA